MLLASPLDSFSATDIAIDVHLESEPTTLADVSTLIRLIEATLEAVQVELSFEFAEPIEFLPVVSVSKGSIRIRVDIRSSNWSIRVRGRMREVFLGATLLLAPVDIDRSDPQTPAISPGCAEAIRAAHDSAVEAWKYFGKGFEAELKTSCGGAVIVSVIKVPPARGR